MHFTIIESHSQTALGTAALLRIDPAHGSIEIGCISFSPRLKRTAAATESMYLMMRLAFDELGYRRYEWKCDSLNAPSRAAAERYGFSFEGVFRNAVVYKGRSRDTAWYSITESGVAASTVCIRGLARSGQLRRARTAEAEASGLARHAPAGCHSPGILKSAPSCRSPAHLAARQLQERLAAAPADDSLVERGLRYSVNGRSSRRSSYEWVAPGVLSATEFVSVGCWRDAHTGACIGRSLSSRSVGPSCSRRRAWWIRRSGSSGRAKRRHCSCPGTGGKRGATCRRTGDPRYSIQRHARVHTPHALRAGQ